jgi:hypothetical protein
MMTRAFEEVTLTTHLNVERLKSFLSSLIYFFTGSKAKKYLSAITMPCFPLSMGTAGISKVTNCTSEPTFICTGRRLK